MTKFLLSVHVLAVIIAIGPVTTAASMFPPAVRRAVAAPDPSGTATLRTLHRICRGYAVVAVAVPAFGLATAHSLHVLGSAWLVTSIALTAVAAAVLGVLVLPRQAATLDALDGPAGAPQSTDLRHTARQLAAYTGTFNMLWATVTVLMIIRPGSTTGA